MTTIKNFPDEVLRVLFEKLNHFDLLQCQKVFSSWYYPAHSALLQKVELEDMAMIRQFIKSINHNPNTYYLNSVQELIFGSSKDISFTEIDSYIVIKLISRFPNLKSITIHNNENCDPLLPLNDNSQADILAKRCPKLEKLELQMTDVFRNYYFDLMYKLRRSLTWIDLSHLSRLDNIENYLADFPQLQAIWCKRGDLNSFEKCLLLIEKLPALKDISIGEGGDEEGFVERYLSSRTKDEQDVLKERLSKIANVVTATDGDFCVNGAKFIIQYLTGLKSLALYSYYNPSWNDDKAKVLISLVEYACNLEETFVNIDAMNPEGLSICLEPLILLMQSHKTDKLKRTNLELSLYDGDDDPAEEGTVGIEIYMNQDCSALKLELRIAISSRVDPYRILDLFDSVSQLDHINSFTFGFVLLEDGYNHDIYKPGYNEVVTAIIRRIPALNQVVLDIPTLIDRSLDVRDTLVTSLTLRANDDITEEEFLKPIRFFRKLKQLQMFYFPGVWQEHLSEFQINLDFCSLEKLTVDLTHARYRMEHSSRGAFIVVVVDVFDKSERRLYKVPTDLLNTVAITDANLEGLTRGKDYIVVHVNINTLECLDVFIYRKRIQHEYFADRDEKDEFLYINLLNNKNPQIL